MNYKNHYDKLMNRAKGRTLEGYTEKHHIVPRCMGGGDESDNIAVLTAEEHYVAHQLLVKMYPGEQKLIFALMAMSGKRPPGVTYTKTNKLYGWLRMRAALINSGRILITDGNRNRFFDSNESIPDGWWKGRYNVCNTGLIRITDGKNNRMIGPEELVPDGWWEGLTVITIGITDGEANKSIPKDQPIPEGWWYGVTGNNGKNNKVYTNGETNVFVYYGKEPPEGFWEGSSNLHNVGDRRWITDGRKNRKIMADDPVPDGWEYGHTVEDPFDPGKLARNKIRITNGVENNTVTSESEIPDGWRRGHTQKHKKKIRITNGKENRRVDTESEIPDGWRLGVTLFNRKRK